MTTLYRAAIMHTVGDPFRRLDREVFRAHEDGALVVGPDGRVAECGDHAEVAARWPGAREVDLRGRFILPAMVDCHIHYPQAVKLAAYGEQLLDWLQKHIFPEESRYADADYATAKARLFFDELIGQGTGTALIFGAHFEEATRIAFQEAGRRRFRAVMGMTLSDREMPQELVLDPVKAHEASTRLIREFHGKYGCRYAVTPRFAPTCSEGMLEACRQLLDENPGVLLQTHINENLKEIAWVRDLFPGATDYLDVYARAGLVGPRVVLAHDLHATERELATMGETDTRVAHCPTSNAFLGSGLFPLGSHLRRGIQVGLGTDVGAGTSYSMFRQMGGCYQMQKLLIYGLGRLSEARKPTPVGLLYLATLGGAKVLGLDEETGSFLPGRAADFLVLDPGRDPIFQARIANCESLEEVLFVIAITGDKRLIHEVYLAGSPAK